MARSAHLPLAADRYEACVRTIRFRGLDLRGAALRAQVRLRPDTPGLPLVDLHAVTNGFAEGLRVSDFAFVDGVPVTTVEMVVNETTMEALPYSGEIGDAAAFAYDVQATLAGRKRKLIWGEFVVLPGVTGADAAPSNRPAGFGPAGCWSTWSTAEVTIVDELASIRIDGSALDPGYWAGVIERAEAGRAIVASRSGVYGITDAAAQRLFTGESVELGFADSFYRESFEVAPAPGAFDAWSYGRSSIASASTATGRVLFFVENAPRLTDQGLLVEGSGVNLFVWSEDFTQAVWTKALASIASNVAPGPRGEGSMDKIVAIGAGTHGVSQAAAGVSTVSGYAKAGEQGWCAIRFDGAGSPTAFFDLVNGVVGGVSAGVTARIERAARGSWRISATIATRNATASFITATGDGAASYDAAVSPGGFYLDMVQAEPNARAYSYVPASAAPASRGADRPVLEFAPGGDFTLYVEAQLPAPRGTDDGLISLTGTDPVDRVALYRNNANALCVQVGDADGLKVAAGPTYADARVVRAAVSVTARAARVSFDGGEVVALSVDRPIGLHRLWLGLIGDTLGFELNGYVRAAFTCARALDDAALRLLTSPGDRTISDDPQYDDLVQAFAIHENSQEAHGLAPARQQMSLSDSKTGMWNFRATDTFSGADGALTTAETGGQAWVAVGAGQPLYRVGGVAKSPDASLRGTYIAAGVTDGQVEADLTPGNAEASLYFRWKQNGDYLLLQRGSDGSIGLKKFVGGAATDLAPVRYLAVEAGERFKVRFIGARIWVLRVVAGFETVMFDVTEAQWQGFGSVGLRLNGTGSADNFRVLIREAI